MPREKRYDSLIISSFYIPSEEKEILKKLSILAKSEGISRSRLIQIIIGEYVTQHWPGNPQTLDTMYFPEDHPLHRPKPPTLEIRIVSKELCELLTSYDRGTGTQEYRTGLQRKIRGKAVKLYKLNEVMKDARYDALLDRASKILGLEEVKG